MEHAKTRKRNLTQRKKKQRLLNFILKHKIISCLIFVVIIIIIVFVSKVASNFLISQKYMEIFYKNQNKILNNVSHNGVKLSDYLVSEELNFHRDTEGKYIWLHFNVVAIMNNEYVYNDNIASYWEGEIEKNIKSLFNPILNRKELLMVKLFIKSDGKTHRVSSSLREIKSNSNSSSLGSSSSYQSSSLSDSDKAYAWTVAKIEVKAVLKSPSTAKFPVYSEGTITKGGNSYTVKGYVDAQNSFGATVRSNFTVTFDKISEDKYNNVSVTVD